MLSGAEPIRQKLREELGIYVLLSSTNPNFTDLRRGFRLTISISGGCLPNNRKNLLPWPKPRKMKPNASVNHNTGPTNAVRVNYSIIQFQP